MTAEMLVVGWVVLVGAFVLAAFVLVDRIRGTRPAPGAVRVGQVVVHTRDEHSIEGLLVGEDDGWVRLEQARLVDGDAEPVALAGSVRVPAGNVRFVQEV